MWTAYKKELMLTMLRRVLSWENTWRIRIVALGTIVLLVVVASQVLFNVIAATVH